MFFKILFFLFVSIIVYAHNDLILNDAQKSYVKNNPVVHFTGDPNWLPYEAFDRYGNYEGMVADHIKIIESRTGLKFQKIAPKSWSEAIDLAMQKKVDVISGDDADVLLNKEFTPTISYLKNPIVLVLKGDNPFVVDLNAIVGKIAIIKDYGYTSAVYEKYPQVDFFEVENIQEALAAVQSEHCTGMLASYALASYSINKYSYHDLKIVGNTNISMNVTLFVDSDKKELYDIINNAIKSIKPHEQQKILQQWSKKHKQLVIYQYLNEIFIGAFVLAVVVFILLYIQSLEKKRIQNDNEKLQQGIQRSLDELDESRKIAKLGIWTLYHDGNRLVWNDDTYAIFDMNKEDKIAVLDDFFNAVHKDDVQKVSKAFENHLQTHQPYFITHRLITHKGVLKHVNEWCKTDFDENGKPLVSHGIVQDVTEARENELLVKQKNEEIIRQSEIAQEELEKIVDMFGENVIASNSDPQGIITYASQALCKISGYTKDELVGSPHSILRHPSMKKEVFQDLWQTIKSGKTWKGEIKNAKKDGGYYWVRAQIDPELDEAGNIVGYSSIRNDITPEKVKEQFLANMSHELRTPLNSILGFIELIEEESNEASIKKYASVVHSSGDGLLRVIEDILDFSKIESGKIEIEKIGFDLHKTYTSLKELFEIKAFEKGVKLSLYLDPSSPQYIKSDQFRIRQITSNLLSNAIKFTSSLHNIYLSVSYDDGFLKVSVKDEGKGIAQDKLSIIFEEFSQEDASTTREYGGTGLGLAISKQLAKLLDGTLEVQSELGIGSEFVLTIPVEAIDSLEEKEEKTDLTVLKNLHVLMAEDNEANQMFMDVMLKKLEITYDLAQDGNEVVDMYTNALPGTYDVILMDENMPNKNGIAATKEILEFEQKNGISHTPIVALTANALNSDRERFLDAGMDEYISKPVNQKKLQSVLQHVV